MAYSGYPPFATQGNTWIFAGRGLGADGATLTIEEGAEGVSIAYVSEGIYRVSLLRQFAGQITAVFGLQAATPGDLKGYSVVTGTWDTSGSVPTIDVHVFNASVTLADLIADQYLNWIIMARDTSRTV